MKKRQKLPSVDLVSRYWKETNILMLVLATKVLHQLSSYQTTTNGLPKSYNWAKLLGCIPNQHTVHSQTAYNRNTPKSWDTCLGQANILFHLKKPSKNHCCQLTSMDTSVTIVKENRLGYRFVKSQKLVHVFNSEHDYRKKTFLATTSSRWSWK